MRDLIVVHTVVGLASVKGELSQITKRDEAFRGKLERALAQAFGTYNMQELISRPENDHQLKAQLMKSFHQLYPLAFRSVNEQE